MAIGYTIAITTLFLIPTDDLPKVKVSEADKIIHVLFFIFLAFTWLLFIFRNNNDTLSGKNIFWITFLLLLYGTLIEVCQEYLTVSRSADFFDIVSDAIGVIIGTVIFLKLKNFFKT